MDATATTQLSVEKGADCVIDHDMGYVYSIKTYMDYDENDKLVEKPVSKELLDKLEWNNIDTVTAEHFWDESGWNSTLTIVFGDDFATDDHPYVMNLDLAIKLPA